MNLLNALMCNLTDTIIYNGASAFVWGEPEVSEVLKAGYEENEEE